MRKFDNVNELVNTLKPDNPVYCIRPKAIKKSVEFFKKNFPGKILYAVKTNPNEKVIKTIINSGIEDEKKKVSEEDFLEFKNSFEEASSQALSELGRISWLSLIHI